jgi:5-methylcytosine-specific restriction endonuclease McrA
MFINRPEYDTPEYKSWRYSVFARDGWTCQICSGKGNIQAHHIIKWAVAPHLRYVQSNGITLCEECHGTVTGHEESFEEQFKRIVEQKKILQRAKSGVKAPIKKKINEAYLKWRPRNPNLRF